MGEELTKEQLEYFLKIYNDLIQSSKYSLEYWERMKKETEEKLLKISNKK
jgi:hypothetical protein